VKPGPAPAGDEGGHGLRAPRLRPRLVITFALVAALTSVGVAVSSYLLVREATFERAEDAAVRESRLNLDDAAERLDLPSTNAAVETFNASLTLRGGFDVVTIDGDGSFTTTTFSLSAASIPAALREPVAAGRVVSMRSTVSDEPYLVVGGRVVPDGRGWYFFFPLDDVVADQALVRNVLAGVGSVLVVVSALVGAAAASNLLRPIRRTRDAVHRLEAGRLETRLPEEGRDELADLARSFNRMAQALESTVGDLRELEANHRRFVADVSHELRTPLTALTTAADVLEANSDGLNDPGRRAGRLLVVESRRLGTLVEDLMEISRLDAGVAQISWEPIDLGIATAGALDQRDVSDRVEAHLPEGVTTYADRRRLDTILGNLIDNALEHGRPPVGVTVSATSDHVVVEVSDAGAGISVEHLDHVFDRFYKADPARPRSAGSGLGLAIARENARLHGGDVTVGVGARGGAAFVLLLPRHQAPPVDGGPGPTVARSLPDGDAAVTGPQDHPLSDPNEVSRRRG
jgi:two-component system sensor histidine kinase MtrB